jgi:hypothetical protein
MQLLNKPAMQAYGSSNLMFNNDEASPHIEKKKWNHFRKQAFMMIPLFFLHELNYTQTPHFPQTHYNFIMIKTMVESNKY